MFLKGSPKCDSLVEHYSIALQGTSRDQFPSFLSLPLPTYFVHVIFSASGWNPKKFPEFFFFLFSFFDYFSLGDNYNTTQISLTSKLWAFIQFKSSFLPLLVPSWLESVVEVEVLPSSSPLLSRPSLVFSSWGGSGELRVQSVVPCGWCCFTWYWYSLAVSQWEIWHVSLVYFLSFLETLFCCWGLLHIIPLTMWYLIYLATLTPGFCWSTYLFGSPFFSKFLSRVHLKTTHGWLPFRRSSCDPNQHVHILTPNSEIVNHF